MSYQTLIDIHCHQYRNVGNLQILSRDTHELSNKTDDILPKPQNSKHQNQADLRLTGDYFSLGIHPWFIELQNIDTAIQTIASFLHHPQLLAIGECGLDKCIDTALDKQIDIFSQQIKLAKQIGKPMIVHCVRAFSELLQLKKQLAPSQAWIIHGFTGKPALAEQLLKHGCYLSFGKALLQSGSQASMALLTTPNDRLFLETDAADAAIDTIYTAAAKIRHVDVACLQQQILNNFQRVFMHD
ncbi:MAG: TatD family hydrolase [Methylomonas lenta]|nr:TatD family hydrolase [Methylomonas lenta]